MDEMQAHHNHQPANSSAAMSDDGTMAAAMGNMAMTFSSSTTVTLLFPGCTTSTPAAYAGALVLLFALSVFHRFLGALRAQLEMTAWRHGGSGSSDDDDRATSAEDGRKVGAGAAAAASWRWWRRRVLRLGSVDNNNNNKRGLYDDDDVEGGASEEKEPLSPIEPDVAVGRVVQVADGYGYERKVKAAGFWTPSGPWRVGRDGARSTLECGRAALGYLLMLAVMTFNVGVFVAVIGGILVGEMAFGRYTQGGSTKQEDGCHD